jgi:hypothetical protein
MALTEQLAEQLDWHWRHQLRPRLDGLTDDEYFWEPVPGMWSIRPRGTSTAQHALGGGELVMDYAIPEPKPAPVTTIAWVMGHLIVGVLGMRAASHFGGPAMEWGTFEYAGSADEALKQFDTAYAAWNAGVRGLSADDLARPIGPAEGPWAEYPMSDLILHINREVIHHGAQLTTLRDLYLWKASL